MFHYEIRAPGVDSIAKGPSMQSKLRQPSTMFLDIKIKELEGLEFFQLRTGQEMCQSFHSDIWTTLILILSRAEPSILHAIIELGALHENEAALGMPISKGTIVNVRHRFAVSQYNSVIDTLTKRACCTATGYTSDAKQNPLVLLVTCLVFTRIDLLRGRYESAILHIRSALSILDEEVSQLPQDLNG